MKKIFYTLTLLFFSFVAQAQNNQNKTTVAPVVTPPPTVVAPTIITDPNDGTGTGTGTGTTPITEVGNTEGQLSVSLTGAATYSIPIAVPPGINGVVPQISLNYSSQAGNGMAGYGWNIGGLSAITRVPQTKFHDGVNGVLKFDNTDRFALDGQRLMLKNPSQVYGADGTIYETENFSNVKVTSYGSALTGPYSFKVEYPDGSFAVYGINYTVTTYAISYWQNAQGVRISYTYNLSNNNLTIASIKYGSTFTNTPINEIQFVYKPRTRIEDFYVAGQLILNNTVLSKIKIIGNGIGFKNYDLAHDTAIGYERLKSITEKTGDNSLSYRPTVFNYAQDTYTNTLVQNLPISTPKPIVNVPPIPTPPLYPAEYLNYSDYYFHSTIIDNLDLDGDGLFDSTTYSGLWNDFLQTNFINSSTINSFRIVNPSTETGSVQKRKSIKVKSVIGNLTTGYKLNNKDEWCNIVEDATNGIATFKTYSYQSQTNPFNLESTKSYQISIQNGQSSNNFVIPVPVINGYFDGDFNGDGITDVISIQSKVYSGNAVSTNGMAKFINLDKRLTTNYVFDLGILPFAPNAHSSQNESIENTIIKVADINGDGKSDLICFLREPINKIYVYTLNASYTLDKIIDYTTYLAPIPIPYSMCCEANLNPLMLGDFNGDGKTDVLLTGSSTRKLLKSTGIGFETENLPASIPSPSKFESISVFDLNNDGKSEIIKMSGFPIYHPACNGPCTSIIGFNPGFALDVYDRINNANWNLNHFEDHSSTAPGYNSNIHDVNHTINTNGSSLVKFIGGITYNFTNSLSNQKLLSNITLGNGVQEKITYSPLTTANGVYTPAGQIENYPNYDIPAAPSWKVVSQISKQSSTSYKSQQFKYYGAVSNVEGLGFQGFRGRLATNWYSDPAEIISNITKHDIGLRGAVTESFSVLGLSTPSAAFDFSLPYINYSTNSYNIVRNNYIDPLLSNKVFKLFNSSSQNFDGLNGVTSSTTNTRYDAYNNPTVISTDYYNNNGVIEKNKVTTIAYNNSLPTDLVYYRGRPKSKIVNETIYPGDPVLEDATTSQELYAYNNHLLTQVKKKGNGTLDELIEDNIYDAYGNITKKTITATGLTPRVTNYEYDLPTHRFLTKKIDIEELETLYTNNSSSGMLLTETLPAVVAPFLPRTTTYLYDKWFKLIKVTDYLGKSVNYTYANNSEGVLKTTTGDDGSMSTLQIDDLGRKIRTGSRNIDTSWSYVTKAYDNNDRLILESAPYNGGASPFTEFSDPGFYTVWNESTYDVYGRVTQTEVQKTDSAAGKIITYSYNGMSATETDTSTSKVKTTEKNSLGNIVSVSDNLGGNITYKYFANGNLKETDCNNSKTTITQDGWGRKKSLYEPSVGTYLYEYNNFGETTKETVVGKGVTEYNINSVGKIIDKKIFDAAGTGLLTKNTYTFDPITKLLLSTRFDDYGNNNSYTIYNYGYDNYKRVISSDESFYQNNLFQVYFKRTTSFDAFGRPERQESTAINKPDGKQMVKAIKNTYKLGYHHTILEDGTNKLLWQTGTVDARGQLTSGTYGNGITITNTYDSYSYPSQKKHDLGTTNVLTLNTAFDPLRGNLTSRTNSLFGWNENFTYDDLDRLLTYKDNNGIQTQNYNPNGSISDNNIGSYAYTTAGMPFRASTITPPNPSAALTYYTGRDQEIKYNVFKSPIEIKEQGKENVDFEYNANNGRSVMYYGNTQAKANRTFRKYYSADGTMEIKRDILNNKVDFVTYIGGDGYDAPIVNKLTYDATTPSGAGGLFYLHRDYQGSIIGITNSTGQVVEKRLFDAWGALIKYGNLAGATTPPTGLGGAGMFIDRGYTGHEHLLNVGLINMNGRIYDPKLHRFLQPDNNIQDPYNTQNYNRYGYVMNNPMKYTDPSGEIWNVIFGYIAAAYIYGAYGNGGELNPTKWDFSNPATYGAATQMISVFASVGLTNVANNYLQSYGANPVMPAIEPVAATNNKPTFVFQNQNFSSDYTPDAGEIRQWTPNWREQWGMSENIFAKMTYETFNSAGIFGQMFMFRSVPANTIRNIDGSTTTSNQAADGVATLAGIAVVEMASFAKGAQIIATNGGTNLVYHGLDAAGTVKYVGITEREAGVRFAEHLNSGTAKSLLDFEIVPGATGLTRTQAKVWEQTLINQYGLGKNGGQLLNKINSIAPKYWWQYGIK